MSSNLMATEKGGEQTQYEAEHSDMVPHKREAGQLGATTLQGASTAQPTTTEAARDGKTNEPNTVGITPAEKIRFGQSIQHGGVGGKTGTVSGEADVARAGAGAGAGAGGDGEEGQEERQRRVQGYGEGRDQDRGVGA